MDNLEKIADGLREMETPLLQVRSLARAVLMMASSDDLPRDAGTALDAVAYALFERLTSLCEDRDRLWKLAGGVA
jgi:hypothetical protein